MTANTDNGTIARIRAYKDRMDALCHDMLGDSELSPLYAIAIVSGALHEMNRTLVMLYHSTSYDLQLSSEEEDTNVEQKEKEGQAGSGA